jgi:serine/threonine-protein kinase
MTLEALSPGAVFAERYRVVRAIARGGMGAVYEVVHLETQRRRALKVILPGVLESEEMRRRFQLEAQVAARIESEFVVDVFDAGIDAATGMPFLVMELLRGEDLGARLKRVGRLAPREVVVVLHQTALALDRMRAANVVHRDLKPENLFLTEREDGTVRIKVLDLGIAKILADGATRSQATRAMGTPLYMAPEQVESESRVTPATDIYALGMIAYTLLVGRAYFVEEAYERGNMFAFALVVRSGPKEAPEVRAARGGVTLPPAFAAWFARATAADPQRRFVTAVSAVADLAAALGVAAPTTGSSMLAGPPSAALAAPTNATGASLTLTGRPTSLRRGVPAALVIAATVLLGGAVSLGLLWRRPQSSLPAPGTAATETATVAADTARASVPTASRPVELESSAATPDAGVSAIDAGAPLRAPPPRTWPTRQRAVDPQGPIYSRD